EAPIRESLSRFLERAGHVVVAVNGGGAALEAARERGFDAILLDIRMPDISGIDVFEQWRAERSELANRVVFLTGDIVSTDLQDFLAGTGQPFLATPFDLGIVLQVLQQIQRT